MSDLDNKPTPKPLQEGIIKKGGIGAKPLTSPPPPPKGEGDKSSKDSQNKE